ARCGGTGRTGPGLPATSRTPPWPRRTERPCATGGGGFPPSPARSLRHLLRTGRRTLGQLEEDVLQADLLRTQLRQEEVLPGQDLGDPGSLRRSGGDPDVVLTHPRVQARRPQG